MKFVKKQTLTLCPLFIKSEVYKFVVLINSLKSLTMEEYTKKVVDIVIAELPHKSREVIYNYAFSLLQVA